jgi:hypothetical protein
MTYLQNGCQAGGFDGHKTRGMGEGKETQGQIIRLSEGRITPVTNYLYR